MTCDKVSVEKHARTGGRKGSVAADDPSQDRCVYIAPEIFAGFREFVPLSFAHLSHLTLAFDP